MSQNTVKYVIGHEGRNVVTAQPSESVLDAVERMTKHGVGSVVVVGNNDLVGVLTMRDVLSRVVAEQRDAKATKVGEVMSTGIVTVSPDTEAQEAMDLVMRTGYCHLPVTNGNDLVGFVTKGDLASWLLRYQEHQIDDLFTYITRS